MIELNLTRLIGVDRIRLLCNQEKLKRNPNGIVNVYVNGILLVRNVDYTTTSEQLVTLINGASGNIRVEASRDCVSFQGYEYHVDPPPPPVRPLIEMHIEGDFSRGENSGIWGTISGYIGLIRSFLTRPI